jgi:hypothetical protein
MNLHSFLVFSTWRKPLVPLREREAGVIELPFNDEVSAYGDKKSLSPKRKTLLSELSADHAFITLTII